MRFSFKRKPKPLGLDAALKLSVSAAIGMAEGLLEFAPGEVSVAELQKVEGFVLDYMMSEMRETWQRNSVPAIGLKLLAKPLEDHFRSEFRQRFYDEVAPLSSMQAEGSV